MAAQWGVRLAARAMMASAGAGTILVTASAGAIFPIPEAPIYAAGVALFLLSRRTPAHRVSSLV